jgi:hypothetical protein
MGGRGGWSERDDGVLAAAQLSQALGGGWRPPAMSSTIALYQGEAVHYETPFTLFEYSGRDVAYAQSTFLALGSPSSSSPRWGRARR